MPSYNLTNFQQYWKRNKEIIQFSRILTLGVTFSLDIDFGILDPENINRITNNFTHAYFDV